MREYQQRPEQRAKRLIANRARAYGITQEEYAGLLAEQSECCAICGRNEKLVVDHDHVTGRVRGLLCNRCNLTLGLASDDTDTLHAMIDYLETR